MLLNVDLGEDASDLSLFVYDEGDPFCYEPSESEDTVGFSNFFFAVAEYVKRQVVFL